MLHRSRKWKLVRDRGVGDESLWYLLSGIAPLDTRRTPFDRLQFGDCFWDFGTYRSRCCRLLCLQEEDEVTTSGSPQLETISPPRCKMMIKGKITFLNVIDFLERIST